LDELRGLKYGLLGELWRNVRLERHHFRGLCVWCESRIVAMDEKGSADALKLGDVIARQAFGCELDLRLVRLDERAIAFQEARTRLGYTEGRTVGSGLPNGVYEKDAAQVTEGFPKVKRKWTVFVQDKLEAERNVNGVLEDKRALLDMGLTAPTTNGVHFL
jgi:hypothetical protein